MMQERPSSRYLGKGLRKRFGDTAIEPVPKSLLVLLDRLEKSELEQPVASKPRGERHEGDGRHS
jgi:hypothetical protein